MCVQAKHIGLQDFLMQLSALSLSLSIPSPSLPSSFHHRPRESERKALDSTIIYLYAKSNAFVAAVRTRTVLLPSYVAAFAFAEPGGNEGLLHGGGGERKREGGREKKERACVCVLLLLRVQCVRV